MLRGQFLDLAPGFSVPRVGVGASGPVGSCGALVGPGAAAVGTMPQRRRTSDIGVVHLVASSGSTWCRTDREQAAWEASMLERGHVQLPSALPLPKGTALFVDPANAGRNTDDNSARNGREVKTVEAVAWRQQKFRVKVGRERYKVDRLSCSIAADHPLVMAPTASPSAVDTSAVERTATTKLRKRARRSDPWTVEETPAHPPPNLPTGQGSVEDISTERSSTSHTCKLPRKSARVSSQTEDEAHGDGWDKQPDGTSPVVAQRPSDVETSIRDIFGDDDAREEARLASLDANGVGTGQPAALAPAHSKKDANSAASNSVVADTTPLQMDIHLRVENGRWRGPETLTVTVDPEVPASKNNRRTLVMLEEVLHAVAAVVERAHWGRPDEADATLLHWATSRKDGFEQVMRDWKAENDLSAWGKFVADCKAGRFSDDRKQPVHSVQWVDTTSDALDNQAERRQFINSRAGRRGENRMAADWQANLDEAVGMLLESSGSREYARIRHGMSFDQPAPGAKRQRGQGDRAGKRARATVKRGAHTGKPVRRFAPMRRGRSMQHKRLREELQLGREAKICISEDHESDGRTTLWVERVECECNCPGKAIGVQRDLETAIAAVLEVMYAEGKLAPGVRFTKGSRHVFNQTGLTIWIDGFPASSSRGKTMGNLGVWLIDRSGELLPKGQSIAFSLAQWMGGEEHAMSLLEAQCAKWGQYAMPGHTVALKLLQRTRNAW